MAWYHRSAVGYLDRSHPTSLFDWYYPSGTPSLIAACIYFFGPTSGITALGVLQALVNGLEVPLGYLIAKRYWGERVGLAAMVLFGTHYLALGFSGLMMSESWLTLGLIGAVALLDPDRPGRSLLAGLALGFGAWAKSQAMLLGPLWALVMLKDRQRKSAAAVLLGLAAVVVPASIVASVHLQRPVILSPNGGQTFALGLGRVKSIHFDDPVPHSGANFGLPDVFQRAGRGEEQASWGDSHYTEPFFDSGFYFREGLACIRRYPGHALQALLLHVADTFAGLPWSEVAPWPETEGPSRAATVGSNLIVAYLVAPLAFWGWWLRRRERAIWYVFGLPFLSLLTSAVLFHGDPRFRVPYDFAFFAAAAAAVAAAVEGRRQREVARQLEELSVVAREP